MTTQKETQEKVYRERRIRFFHACALKWALKLFDESAFKHPGTILDEAQPGVAYAKEMGWIVEDGAFYHLTSDGIVIAAEMASEREDWYLKMAVKVGRQT